MGKRIEGIEFYLQQLKRIASKENIKLSRKALIELAKYLEKHVRFICKRAAYFTNKEHRKIVKEKDLKEATSEGVLIPI